MITFKRLLCVSALILLCCQFSVFYLAGLSTISEILRNRRLSLFGHVARLDPEVPANKALLLTVNSHEGRKPSTSWTRPPGRPCRTWLNLVQENAIPLSSLWRTEIFRGHGVAQQSVRTTGRWWWWWWASVKKLHNSTNNFTTTTPSRQNRTEA